MNESGSAWRLTLWPFHTAKYAELADEAFFKTVTTDGDYVTWGGEPAPDGQLIDWFCLDNWEIGGGIGAAGYT